MIKNAELIALALAVAAVALIYRARMAPTAPRASTVPLDPIYWNSHDNF